MLIRLKILKTVLWAINLSVFSTVIYPIQADDIFAFKPRDLHLVICCLHSGSVSVMIPLDRYNPLPVIFSASSQSFHLF
jgi:hypothetical protein